jgi:hypothetical protein
MMVFGLALSHAGKNADFGRNTGEGRMFCSKIKPIFEKKIIMSTAIAEVPIKRRKASAKIPDFLIYEVVKGKPIYYKGYKEVLNGTKTFEEITTESILQSSLKAFITALIFFDLRNKGYYVTVGEMGINLSRQDKRGADISIFSKEKFKL